MALKLELTQKLSQQLILTPQLQMAIKLLQMTRLEMEQMIHEELEQNPTLEMSDLEPNEETNQDSSDLGMQEDAVTPEQPTQGNETPTLAGADQADPDSQVASDLQKAMEEQSQSSEPDMDWDSYFDSYMDGPSDILPRDTGDEDKAGFEQFLTKETTLGDYLLWQLRFSSLDQDLHPIGEEIIGNLNDDGYLSDISLENIAEQLEVPLESVQKVHSFILRFDPIGVAARDLRECLMAQAKFSEKRHALASRVLEEHWDLVRKRNIPKLAKALKVSKADIEEAMRAITSLDPKPGSQYVGEQAEYITPDIYVYKVGDEYHIQLNDDGLPKLRLSGYYQRALHDKSNTRDTKDYLRGKLRSAAWLIRSIQQRQRTIYKVTESIVTQQRDFLDNGVSDLRPMVLRDIAEDIGMHECTVSRVTTNKYVHTPQGIFELKYFFTSGVTNTEGEGVSSESIKDRIRQLVDEENPSKPLSDQKLAQILKEEGVNVARRTVAKYREMLGILSSSGRRKTY